MGKDGKSGESKKRLIEKQVGELVDEKPVEMNGIFAVVKGATKQRLILDARSANYNLINQKTRTYYTPNCLPDYELKGKRKST